jgi:hypothetical protein
VHIPSPCLHYPSQSPRCDLAASGVMDREARSRGDHGRGATTTPAKVPSSVLPTLLFFLCCCPLDMNPFSAPPLHLPCLSSFLPHASHRHRCTAVEVRVPQADFIPHLEPDECGGLEPGGRGVGESGEETRGRGHVGRRASADRGDSMCSIAMGDDLNLS